ARLERTLLRVEREREPGRPLQVLIDVAASREALDDVLDRRQELSRSVRVVRCACRDARSVRGLLLFRLSLPVLRAATGEPCGPTSRGVSILHALDVAGACCNSERRLILLRVGDARNPVGLRPTGRCRVVGGGLLRGFHGECFSLLVGLRPFSPSTYSWLKLWTS